MKISNEELKSLIALYAKHGWRLERIVLRQLEDEGLSREVPADVEITEGDVDAAWFTRSSKEGMTTWEIRSLEGDQYALCITIDDNFDEMDKEDVLSDLEMQMRDRKSVKTPYDGH